MNVFGSLILSAGQDLRETCTTFTYMLWKGKDESPEYRDGDVGEEKHVTSESITRNVREEHVMSEIITRGCQGGTHVISGWNT